MSNSIPDSVRAPRSASCLGLNVAGLVLGLLSLALYLRSGAIDPGTAVLLAVGAVALPIAVGDVFWLGVTKRASTGLSADPLRPFSATELALRLIGLAVTLAVIGFAYWLFPEYHGGFYEPYWQFLRALAWPTLLLAPVYLLWIGRHIEPANDPYLTVGRIVLGRGWGPTAGATLRSHCLAWVVKAFFLPLMVVFLNHGVFSVLYTYRALSWDTIRWYQFGYELAFFIDLLFCVVGYTFTLRVLDSHIRSTEPTAFGWIVALICYQPFYSVIGNMYLRYDESGMYWDIWLAPYPTVRAAWAAAILALLLVYALATVSFGLRFSNLTHRGIITSGPYRLTKHPAYVTKNLSWWLISIPFITQAGWLEGLRHCLLLLGINGIYFLRAVTEERHLGRDPSYLKYAEWIRQHGMVAWARRLAGRPTKESAVA